ncbi:hypothetical protein KO481_38030 [Nocardia sp. NEAU-G5]|uniref:Uncharacterized protein n=1 Tax=Nocardia albiluteola TaxID=2842303 RepID=A0ABS6BAI5_9NOCA|nr:hypothetical protein [Nocardia albiluteola]MBU3067308.1 hypothetical protein [Nocardia albiluteola]
MLQFDHVRGNLSTHKEFRRELVGLLWQSFAPGINSSAERQGACCWQVRGDTGWWEARMGVSDGDMGSLERNSE